MVETTDNAFLGGRLRVLQPKTGYRSGIEPVLLAASVPGRAGQSVLELGCGVGTALLCMAARVPGICLTGVEIQADYAELARRNAVNNGVSLQIHTADLTDIPSEIKSQSFDYVIANPPFFRRDSSRPGRDPGRETGRGETIALNHWINVAARRLKPGGSATFIQRIERLPELIQACGGKLGSLEVMPLNPRKRRAARLILLRAKKGGQAAFVLHAPVVLHSGDFHLSDGEDYCPRIREVLRNGAELPIGSAS